MGDWMEGQFARALERASPEISEFTVLHHYHEYCQQEYTGLHQDWEREVPTSVTAFKLLNEKNAVRLERDTWLLALRLLQCKKTSLPEVDLHLIPGYNTTVRDLADHLLESSRELKESTLVLAWLEEIALLSDTKEFVRDGRTQSMKGLEDETVQEALKLTGYQRDIDPHATEDICRAIWQKLRKGLYDEATKVCKGSSQSWRAASLLGHEFHANPGQDIGNPYFKLFRSTLRQIIDNSRNLNAYEQAIYGLQCSHLESMIQVCHTWEDSLWAEMRVLRDIELLKQIYKYPTELDEDDEDMVDLSAPTLEDIFSNLRNSSSKTVQDDSASPYRVVQELIILGEIDTLVDRLSMWCAEINESTSSSTTPVCFLRFSCHLLIFLQQTGFYTPHDEKSQGKVATIIRCYIDYLIHTNRGTLVAFYTSFLPNIPVQTPRGDIELPVHVYAHFLVPCSEYDERWEYLQLAFHNKLDVHSITEQVVFEIMSMPDIERPDDINRITTLDQQRIQALEWLLFDEEQHTYGLWEANTLIRTFLLTNKIDAATAAYEFVSARLSERLTKRQYPDEDYYKVLISTDSVGEEEIRKALIEVNTERIVREYLCLEAYIKAIGAYADWAVLNNMKPQGGKGRSSASEHWKSEFEKKTKEVLQLFYRVLRYPHGWLTDKPSVLGQSIDDAGRAKAVDDTRKKCIPQIFLYLHNVLINTDVRQSLSIVTLVADEHYQLYECFSQQELQHFLQLIRKSAIQLMEEESKQKLRA